MIFCRAAVYSASESVPPACNFSSSSSRSSCRRLRRRGHATGRGRRGLLLSRGTPDHSQDLLAHRRVVADVDRAAERQVVGLVDLQDLHQRAGLPTEVIGLVVLGMLNLRGHHAGDQCACLPIDLVFAGVRVHQHHEFARGDDGLLRDVDGHPLSVAEIEPGSADVQVQADHRPLVDAHSGFTPGP